MKITNGFLCALLGIALWSGAYSAQAIPVRNPETGDVFPSIAQAAKGARVSPKTARRWARV